MKKTCLLLSLLLTGLCANAQYFHSTYGDNATAFNGAFTTTNSIGHIVAGIKDQNVTVARTDENGDFTQPENFNYIYELIDAASAQPLTVSNALVLELSSGNGHVVIGSYSFNSDYGIFYLPLDIQGNPSGPLKAYINPNAQMPIRINAISESVNVQGDIYGAGSTGVLGNVVDVIAFRLDANGDFIWSYIYDFSNYDGVSIADVTEGMNGELMIVGTCKRDGLWITLDQNDGNPLNVDMYDAGRDERFTSIHISEDPLSQGYVLSGTSDIDFPHGQWRNRMLGMKTDAARNVEWFNYYFVESHTGIEEEGVDIAGRLNTLGDYEYFLTGYTYDNSVPSGNSVVVRLAHDGTISGMPLIPMFHFVLSNYIISPVSVAASDNGATTGLSIYATALDLSTGQPSMMISKVYFNGEAACNDWNGGHDVAPTALNYSINNIGTDRISRLDYNQVDLNNQYGSAYNNICHASSVPGGSNARAAVAYSSTPDGVKVFPNPVGPGADLHIALNAEQEEIVEVRMTDLSGRTLYTGRYRVFPGYNNLTADKDQLPGTPGIYGLSIIRASKTEHMKISIR